MKPLQQAAGRIGIPPAMLAFWLAIMAMTLGSTLYVVVVVCLLHRPFPFLTPLGFSGDQWFDFLIFNTRFQHFRTPSFWDQFEYPFTYPAPLAVVYGLLYMVPHALRYYLIAYAGATVAFALIFRRALVDRGLAPWVAAVFTATALLTNYPIQTLFDTANTEGIVVVIAATGVWLTLRHRYLPGAVLIGLAGSMKIFPFILLALLLSKRRIREFAAGLLTAAAVNLASLAYVGPSISEAQRHIDIGIRFIKDTFIASVDPATLTFNHSLFTVTKFVVMGIERHLHPMVIHNRADFLLRAAQERPTLDLTFTVYVTCAGLFGFAVYFLRIRHLPMLNQLLALTACALFLPPLSADYTLLHLLLPFALLCFYAIAMQHRGIAVPGLERIFLCFAPLMAFQVYIHWHFLDSCQFRTLGLVLLLVTALRYPLQWDWLDDSPTPAPSPIPVRA